MGFIERKEKILHLLDLKDTLTIHEIVEQLNSSSATIRRDIALLEKQHILERYWGGIKKIETPEFIRESGLKYQQISNHHELIGKIAANQLQDNELIFIGSGMTTLAMIPFIEHKNIHVVTNGIPQLEALHRHNIQALLLCGFFKEYSRSVVGKETVEMLRSYKFDHAFLGTNGLNEQYCPLSADAYEDAIKTLCIKQSKDVFLLAGNDKFNRTAYYYIPSELAKDVKIITNRPDKDHPAWKHVGDGYVGRIGSLLEND